MILSDEGPMLETLNFTVHIGSTPTFLYFDLHLHERLPTQQTKCKLNADGFLTNFKIETNFNIRSKRQSSNSIMHLSLIPLSSCCLYLANCLKFKSI